MFDLPPSVVHSTISKMIINEELQVGYAVLLMLGCLCCIMLCWLSCGSCVVMVMLCLFKGYCWVKIYLLVN